MHTKIVNNTKQHTLIVKNLPKYVDNLEALIQNPEAEIQTFGRRRALLHFKESEAAEKALLELEERGLTIARFSTEKEEGKNAWTPKSNKATQTAKLKANCNQNLDLNLNFEQPPPSHLKYSYPRITPCILQNISTALMSNTRFYTQVLHLMNRMNLEPPFEAKTNSNIPFSTKEISTQTESTTIFETQTVSKPSTAIDEEIESELETSGDEKIKVQPIKRKLNTKTDESFKKKARKVLHQTQKSKATTNSSHHQQPKQSVPLNTAFENVGKRKPGKLTLKVTASSLDAAKTIPNSKLQLPINLNEQQMSLTELQALPIYKNYAIGAPSNKLYIKNLAKQVTEADLQLLYERFVTLEHLDIKVMQQGRMKGQAFVTFSHLSQIDTQQIIAKALQHTHGFILYDKPMIVCYGRQLGLVESIYVDADGNTTTKPKKQHYNQPYTYVVAVDFEATCWEKQAPPHWREAEIIEFPAVLFNLKTGKIEAEFHKYIMPLESPILSAFCTELTGISQKTVESGVPLQTALMMFHEWLRKELRSRHLVLPKMSKDNKIGNCAFVTWTDWDFGVCLAKECQRKRLKKPPFFNQWIDLRAIYREWYSYRPTNFNDALNHVGLTFEGRAHSGIDDAKNLAALTYKLVRDGATLALTKDLTPFQLNLNCIF